VEVKALHVFLTALLCLALLLGGVNAEVPEFQVEEEKPSATAPLTAAPPAATPLLPQPTEVQPADPPVPGWPETDAAGFLEDEAGEFVHADEPAGLWAYLSRSLRVVIRRESGRVERHNLVWYIADIRFRGEEAFRAYSADPKNPSRAKEKPEKIAQKNGVVYAQNGDLFSWRLYNHEKPGLIIRDGKILYEDTYTRAIASIPPLDELALYPDGRVEMRVPGEMSAQGYLDRGAIDVLAFGPILFRDGAIDNRLEKSFTNLEPRSAIGVAGPGHFIGIMVEGRNQRSEGAGLRFVAERLMELGCETAFTLDGGQTAAMIFMGINVMDPGIYNGFQKTRRQQDIIGIGRF
jgi:hypothetical protein